MQKDIDLGHYIVALLSKQIFLSPEIYRELHEKRTKLEDKPTTHQCKTKSN